MINKEIKTYNEIKRAKNAYSFAQYYQLDNAMLNYIYDFTEAPNHKVVGNATGLFFYVDGKLVKKIDTKLTLNDSANIRSVEIYDGGFYIIPVPSSSSYSSSSYSDSSSSS